MDFLSTDVHLIAYQDSGESYLPVLIMAHPLGMSHAVWDDVCDQLHGQYRCIRWDIPGHGSSGAAFNNVTIELLAQDVLALADALEINSFNFIGTSIGGVIGQCLCKIAPERLGQVCLTNTGVMIGTPQAWAERAENVRQLGLAEMAEIIVSRWFAPSYIGLHPEVLQGWKVQLARTDNESYARLCEALAKVDNRNSLKGFTRNVILVGGAKDISTPPATLEVLQVEFTNAQLTVFADVGHVPSVEIPEKLVNFFQSESALNSMSKY